jgi:hypothetical protein
MDKHKRPREETEKPETVEEEHPEADLEAE